jgi:hypothetical protein
MPKLKNYLPDVNVWLALVAERHVHNAEAARWFDSVRNQQVAFCRVTQMGLLRLLTNRKVMGVDVQTMAKAWAAYERARVDARVLFLTEPYALESEWRRLTSARAVSTNTWTDTYLSAFAATAGLEFVTFDKKARRGSQGTLLLG